ncbi:MAG: NAD(P)/FAD-dependent oxidoreductase [Bacteroidales bacterium]
MGIKKKIVIVGGGFAGINFAKKLDADLFDVTIIDELNYHQFQPLFYQVATSQIEPSSISFPLRYIFRHKKHISIRLAKVTSVDTANNKIITNIGEYTYDFLVLAMGCKTNYFGNTEISKHSLSLKTTVESISVRNHILQVFENIITASDEEKEALLNIVLVGGGPTGVELSGAFAEIKKNILPKDYQGIDFSKLEVILVEGSHNTLNSMSPQAQRISQNYLENLGVKVLTDAFVTNYDGETLVLSNHKIIKTKTVIWAAGVTANTISGIPDKCLTKGNRIIVNRFNKMLDSDNIFVVGDQSYMETSKYPQGHPQVANVAIKQAENLAKNLKNILNGEELKEYEYKDYGTMATIGKNKAVVDLPFMRLQGFWAWIIWMFLHLMLILSVRNKLIIFINWAWAYITKNTALRIILKVNE